MNKDKSNTQKNSGGSAYLYLSLEVLTVTDTEGGFRFWRMGGGLSYHGCRHLGVLVNSGWWLFRDLL